MAQFFVPALVKRFDLVVDIIFRQTKIYLVIENDLSYGHL